MTAISLGTTLPQPSSGLPGNSGGPVKRSLSDLAPGEVYPASPITRAPGGLLHHRFTLTDLHVPRKVRSSRRSALCCTFSRITPGGCYPPPCPVVPGRSSASGTHSKRMRPGRRDRLAGPFAPPGYRTRLREPRAGRTRVSCPSIRSRAGRPGRSPAEGSTRRRPAFPTGAGGPPPRGRPCRDA